VQEDKNWWKDKLKTNDLDDMDFQIDTRGTFADGLLSSVSAASKNASAIGNNKAVNPRKEGSSSAKKSGPPIIIVPSAVTSLITMYNVKEFLEEGKFITATEKKQQTPTKPTHLEIKKRLGVNLPVPFHVIDCTTKLTPHDWGRVVAVFVLGQAWQFKDWYWPAIVEIFVNVKGFYLKYDDAVIPADVKSWSVKTLSVSKSKRHLDQTAALQFWNTLDEFLIRRHV